MTFFCQTAQVVRPLTPYQTGKALDLRGIPIIIRAQDRGRVDRDATNLLREPYLLGSTSNQIDRTIARHETICYFPLEHGGLTYAGNWVPQEEWKLSLRTTNNLRMEVNRLVTTQSGELRTMVVHQEKVFAGDYATLKAEHPRGRHDVFADFTDEDITCTHQFFVRHPQRGLMRTRDPRPKR